MADLSFWDSMITAWVGSKKPREGAAYASTFPLYEIQSPQYPVPSPYTLAQQGYRTNELIYSCIGMRAAAISEPPLWVYNDSGETPEEVSDHPLRQLMRKPNERISEKSFWQINQIFLDIAGFSAWEVERNNLGEPLALWPMRPDWCSFYRGEGRFLRAVRYQPYGLPPADIPIDNVLLFQYFDPLFPMLKGFSPTMACFRQLGVDNNTSDFLNVFMQEGAQFSGLLRTVQSLNDSEADRIKQRVRSQHGGARNWGQNNILVLGNGVEYQSTQMTFKDMVFPELDARTESRICMVYKIPPILIGAKIGMDRSTYSNYSESRKAWYEGWVTSQWEWLSSEFGAFMLPQYEDNPDDFYTAFMTHSVKALQEDKNLSWTRATTAATAGIITRDEAREEMGLDPIDDVPVFVGASAPAVGEESTPGETPEQLIPFAGQDNAPAEPEGETPAGTAEDETDIEEQEAEIKRFRAFAKRRIAEGKKASIKSFRFVAIPQWRQAELMREVGITETAPFRWQEVEY